MENFPRAYTLLFNAATDALRAMEARNFGKAAEVLKWAQVAAEELYISENEAEYREALRLRKAEEGRTKSQEAICGAALQNEAERGQGEHT